MPSLVCHQGQGTKVYIIKMLDEKCYQYLYEALTEFLVVSKYSMYMHRSPQMARVSIVAVGSILR